MRERGSGSRYVVERALQKAGLRLGGLRIVMELDSTEAILSCVEEGLGVGFVSQWAVLRRHLVMLGLKKTVMRRSFSFVSARGPELPAPAAAMLRFLRNHKIAHKQN
jgi:DNA-binding transcriptional LysR family regulator